MKPVSSLGDAIYFVFKRKERDFDQDCFHSGNWTKLGRFPLDKKQRQNLFCYRYVPPEPDEQTLACENLLFNGDFTQIALLDERVKILEHLQKRNPKHFDARDIKEPAGWRFIPDPYGGAHNWTCAELVYSDALHRHQLHVRCQKKLSFYSMTDLPPGKYRLRFALSAERKTNAAVCALKRKIPHGSASASQVLAYIHLKANGKRTYQIPFEVRADGINPVFSIGFLFYEGDARLDSVELYSEPQKP